ncbi:MAG: 30S ribosomal protein S13 [candidate division WS2 bacterium ADurb.Bin280]|uniref:Small ribosomal subunit protein uS13 n=1 Tax=candidate division WS2 bacterium ADurb.Bin280 TaxID=1852829 RepID=A0A1V5SC14_9BACT|nr:MAG: 30S ribosomal protein S13 [candidate division WS2 bacterium ADurb.Bin280]
MIRIAGINLPENKRADVALSYLQGIGLSNAKAIIEKAGLDFNQKLSQYSESKIEEIRRIIEKEYVVEGDLRTEVGANIKRLKEVGSYRGQRHIKNLPSRGQRTKTNARTKRGKKITVGSGRKKAADFK